MYDSSQYVYKSLPDIIRCSIFIFSLQFLVVIFQIEDHQNVSLNHLVKEILIKSVKGKSPLPASNLRDFRAFVDAYADEIVKKWIDYFVLHKQISCENISRRIK